MFICQNNIEETPMFDPKLLEKLKADFESISKVSFKPTISPANPGNDLLMRPLQIGDYDKGKAQSWGKLSIIVVSKKEGEEKCIAWCFPTFFPVTHQFKFVWIKHQMWILVKMW